nr:uncharacterized protein LOC128677848 [Plodia interpunctella]
MSHIEFSIDRLIKEVQSRRLLYDTSLVEYRDVKAKEREWVEVCRELSKTNDEISDWDDLSETEKTDFLIEAKKKWTSLRDCFKREQKLYQKNIHNKKKYLFFDKLKFLEPYSRSRGSIKNTTQTADRDILHEEVFINNDAIKPEIASDDSNEVIEDKIVEIKTNTNNTIKILTPQEISRIRGKNFVLIDNAERKAFGNDDNRKRKREADKNNDNYEKNKMIIREYECGEFSGCSEPKKDVESVKIDGLDDDQAFLKSILPTFKALTTEQKFRLRIEIMQTILKFKVDNKIFN